MCFRCYFLVSMDYLSLPFSLLFFFFPSEIFDLEGVLLLRLPYLPDHVFE